MEIRKNIEFTSNLETEDGSSAMFLSARINSDNPAELYYSPSINNQDLYKTNREKVKADQKTFEDAVYAEQDKLIAEKAKVAK